MNQHLRTSYGEACSKGRLVRECLWERKTIKNLLILGL